MTNINDPVFDEPRELVSDLVMFVLEALREVRGQSLTLPEKPVTAIPRVLRLV
ncbi:MAG: hypothetical protein ACHQCH_04795 [Solirubrobacterales bacterium]